MTTSDHARRVRCGECGEMTRSADPFGHCPKCAAAIGDDGSYTLEGAINEVLFPLARERLHRELAALHARCEQAEATVARLGAALVEKQARLVYHSGHHPDSEWGDDGDNDYFYEVARDYLREEGLLPAPPAATGVGEGA